MIILREKKQPLFEMVQAAGNREYIILIGQMEQNPGLAQTLNTPIVKLEKYKYLFDAEMLELLKDSPIFKNATLLDIIVLTMKRPQFESYFVKTPKGLYVGFIAISIAPEDGKPVVEDVKTFSFGLENSDDENQMYRDLPGFLDRCLAKYNKVAWTAMDGNKANRSYEIYTKRKKGTITKDGKHIRYVCQR
jgi:hypothetical protein